MNKRVLTLLLFYVVFAVLFVLTLTLKIPSFIALPLFLAALIAILLYTLIPYLPPMWAGRVRRTGKHARAMVLSKRNKNSAAGADHWLDVQVRVTPEAADAFEAKMKCKMSQSAKLQEGSEVFVFFDPADKKRVILEG